MVPTWLRPIPLLLIVTTLAACGTSTVGDKPFIGRNNAPPSPPRTLAILPTTDATGSPELAKTLRQALFRAATELVYEDVELRQVDARLAVLATRMAVPPERLPSSVMAHPSVGDLELFSQIDDVSRLYLLVYARIRLTVRVALVDTRTRAILYRNTFTIVDRLGGPTLTIVDLLKKFWGELRRAQPSDVEQTLDKAAEQIVHELPPQHVDRAMGGKLRLVDVQVNLPTPILRAGGAIAVRVAATPRCRVEAVIPPAKEAKRLREVEPGIYETAYTVRPGDDIAYGIVEVSLDSPGGGEKLTYAVAEFPFSIDTVPPPCARIARWWPDEQTREGLFLELAVQAQPLEQTPEMPRRFLIHRREIGVGAPPISDFAPIGSSDETVYHDTTAVRGRQYEYFVIAEDAAGNRSQPGETSRLRFQ